MKKVLLYIYLIFSFFIFNSFPQSSWEIISLGTNIELSSIYFSNYEVGYACGDSGIVIKSIDSGKTWQSLQTPTTHNLNDLFVLNENAFCVVGDQGTTLFSGNGGSSWTVGTVLTQDDLLSVSFSGNTGICGGTSQTIMWGTYTGTGIIWLVTQSGFFGGGFSGTCSLTPQIGFVAGENSIFQPLFGKTSDGGVTWNFTAFYLNNNEGQATGIDFTDLSNGYISARVWDGTGAIAKTTDGGNNWTSTMFSNPLWSVDFPISNASQVGYAVGDDGTILKTYDAGVNWHSQVSGTSIKLNKVHFIDPDFGFAVGENGIILRTTTGGGPVTIVENENQSPYTFQLFQNFPNPFNPVTNIRFRIAKSGFVTLIIYDQLGNKIATLVNEEKPAGDFDAEFDASKMASGIYYYRLNSGSLSQTKKMILLK